MSPRADSDIDLDAPFPEKMTARDDAGNHHVISRDVQRSAFVAWTRRTPSGREGLNYGALGHQIDRAMETKWDGAWAFARVADRLVQSLRKAGWIELHKPGRGWRLTELGARARDALS